MWLPQGYSIDQKKTVLIETVGLPWMLQWGSLVAADLAHLVLGTGPIALTTTSLASCTAGFVALYGALRKLHPLMGRLAKVDKALRYRHTIIATVIEALAAVPGGRGLAVARRMANALAAERATWLCRFGTTWNTAYVLFRMPTGITAGLCAARAAADAAALGVAATGTKPRDAITASLAVLVVMMAGGIVMLHHLDELAFSMTVVAWLFGLILATHTGLMVKCFAIALNFALGMRAALKYLGDDEEEEKRE
ncbi:hypothetical protein GPECTOR_450g349 [Gonium pectorale]|uniref:Uncharacterized protein n=1 Tax=Gonium pectorale TaxID=33097 RepID=A0A150FV37_GONPE|nr:hypothetical protein GPECTOR_450g349 [Gonium pectorale]|eukprot:KXZ41467.1 hypothetical protein GPECTOR_450g349 [Gonium pectorale]